jgi:hypothetical protein
MDESKIDYPTIEVPGKGTCTVSFELHTVYALEKFLHIDYEQIGAELRKMFVVDPETHRMSVGKVSFAFLMDVLAACLHDQTGMDAETLAKALRGTPITSVARAVMVAFSKAPELLFGVRGFPELAPLATPPANAGMQTESVQ